MKDGRKANTRNLRGGSADRRRRRRWLVEAFRADVDVVELPFPLPHPLHTDLGQGLPACRCYRCGVLVTEQTVVVNRVSTEDGYARHNIRPACRRCGAREGKG